MIEENADWFLSKTKEILQPSEYLSERKAKQRALSEMKT
jgi:hypothetical protein